MKTFNTLPELVKELGLDPTIYDTANKLGQQIGATRGTIQNWLRWGYIPESAAWRIQGRTRGAFDAEKYLAERG